MTTTKSTLAWVEKYRPETFAEVASHAAIIATLEALIDRGCFPNCIFWGPPGNGKSSVATACARRLNGDNWRTMLLELNASDDRSIQVVRQQIKVFASTGSLSSFASMTAPSSSPSSSSSLSSSRSIKPPQRIKFVFLDEADQMSTNAQFALRRIMEKCAANVRFCLTANHVNKIIPSLQSRCTRFRFCPLPPHDVTVRLHHILGSEKLAISKDAVVALSHICKGDMRVALNLAQMCSALVNAKKKKNKKQDDDKEQGVVDDGDKERDTMIGVDMVYKCAGVPPPAEIRTLLTWMLSQSSSCLSSNGDGGGGGPGAGLAALVARLNLYLQSKGFGLNDILAQVRDQLHDLGLPPAGLAAAYLVLSEIEFNLASGGSEPVQCAAFAGLFME